VPTAVVQRVTVSILAVALSALMLPSAEAQPSKVLQGKATEVHTVPFPSLGIEIRKEGKTMLPAQITKVSPGQPGAQNGLLVGDRIIDSHESGSLTAVTVERNGKVFRAKIYTRPSSSTPMVASIQGKAAETPLSTGIESSAPKTGLAALSGHDIVLIIDKSGSMQMQDCPGQTSRWQWCADQTAELSRAAAGVLKQPMTISVFSDDFTIFDRVNIDSVHRIFRDNRPGGGTNTAYALDDQLDRYFQRARNGAARPLLIAVITDGVPNDPVGLGEVILSATHRIRTAGDITITFLQVGHEGDTFLSELDQNLVNAGARCDIVNWKNFQQVTGAGIKNSLVAAFTESMEKRQFVKPYSASLANKDTVSLSGPRRSNLLRGSNFSQGLTEAEQRRGDIEEKLFKKYGIR
jgi:Mg-chelatase subunit ChlD